MSQIYIEKTKNKIVPQFSQFLLQAFLEFGTGVFFWVWFVLLL
jgi:hypothetical protein